MFSLVSAVRQRLHHQNTRRRLKSGRGLGYQRRLVTEQLEDRRLLTQTVGVFVDEPAATEGYTLFAPELTHRTYLINNNGNQVHAWPSDYDPANSGYLEPDGSIWRGGSLGLSNVWPWTAAGVGGIVEQIDWDGRVVAQFRLNVGTGTGGANARILHHDIEPLPNGNVAMIAFDYVSESRARNLGRDPDLIDQARARNADDTHLIPDSIIEVAFDAQGRGTIVWEWHVEDHFVQDLFPNKPNYVPDVSEAPGRIDINYVHPSVRAQADMTHANGLEYIEELDQFILSVRSFSEIWVIDHNTVWDPARGINEPAGPKGDLLYRWGNPAAYGAGTLADQQSFFQHDPLWVPSDFPEQANPGTITFYSNGDVDPQFGAPQYSTVENIKPPIVYNPDGSFSHYAMETEPYRPGVAGWGPSMQSAQQPAAFGTDNWITLAKFPTRATSPMESGDEINFSPIISGAQRMTNGNTLVTEGVTGTIFEVTPDNELVWEYVNPYVPGGKVKQGDPVPLVSFFPPVLNTHTNFVFKARRYEPGYLQTVLSPDWGDTAGLFDAANATWYLNNRSDGTIHDLIVFSGGGNFLPVAGDWDGDGVDTVGLYDKKTNTWYLNNNDTGVWDDSVIVLHGGPANTVLQPIAGDWDGPDGDGIKVDTPGLYDWRTNTWHLYATNDPNAFQARTFSGPNHRQQSWRPIAGDWDGDGVDTVGLYIPALNIWYLNNRTDGSITDMFTVRGPRHNRTDWRPIAGDWNLGGSDKIGLYVPGSNIWYLNNRIDGSISNLIAFQGPLVPTSWKPIAGNWNGSQAGGVPGAAGEAESGYVQLDVATTELGLAVQSTSALDTNMDGHVSPADALMVINTIIKLASGSHVELANFPDVNGDMLVTPIDALLVINYLNRHVVPIEAEGESAAEPVLNATFPTQEIVSFTAHEQSLEIAPSGQLTSAPVVAPWADTADLAWQVAEPAEPVVVPRRPVSHTEAHLESILDDVAEDIADAWDS